MSAPQGWPSQLKLGSSQFTTIQEEGSQRYGMDVVSRGVFSVASDAAENTSTTTTRTIDATANAARVGDVIRFTSGANIGVEMGVQEKATNSIILTGTIPSIASGDTFSIMRYITPTLDSSGGIISSSGPIQFVLDGVDTEVSQDTVTPANSVPLPVTVLNPDGTPSVDYLQGHGDSTDINPVGKVTVQPMNGQRFGLDVYIRGGAFITTAAVEAGSTTTVLNVTAHPVKPGDSLRFLDFTSLRLYEVGVQSTTTNTITLAGTLPFTPTPTETFAISRAITPQFDQTGKQYVILDAPNGGFATADRQGNVNETAPTTDTASSGQNGRLQRIAQRLTSLMTFTPVGLATLDFTGTPVTSAAYVELVPSAAATKKVQIFMSQGQPLLLAFGPAAAEVDQIYVIPGGNGLIDLTIPAATRVSLKAVSTTANTGYILVNFLG